MELKISRRTIKPPTATAHRINRSCIKIMMRDHDGKFLYGKYVMLSGNAKQRRSIRRAIFNVIGETKNG